MAKGSFVSYLRVSTQKQGQSGLGLEAQRKTVEDYLNGGDWNVIEELVEIESGKNNRRPKLNEAIDLCKASGATLVVAKIDRLTRDAAFLLSLKDAGIDFIAADMPGLIGLLLGSWHWLLNRSVRRSANGQRMHWQRLKLEESN